MVRNVVAHAPCSVLVVPRDAAMWSRHVLAAVEPGAGDLTAVGLAAAVAAECRLPLTITCVADAESRRAAAEQTLQQALATARPFEVRTDTLLLAGRAHERIVGAARQLNADLLVLGHHRDEGLSRVWLGDVAQKVIGLAERPVLVAAPPPSPNARHP